MRRASSHFPKLTLPLVEGRLPRPMVEFLRRAGEAAPGAIYLVGGVVRDLLLGRQGVDLDLVVEGNAIALARRLAQEGGGRAVTHPRFGTARLEMEGWAADLASARSETYPFPGALPQVAPGSIEDDLARRDFTINALALHLEPPRFGQLLDPHDGLADLKAGLIRVLHPQSFVDDATRILRALRYEMRLSFRLEAATEALVRQHGAMLDTISGDRLRHELELILKEERPERVLARCEELGVLEKVSLGLRGDGWLAEALGRARAASDLPWEICLLLLSYPLSQAQVEVFTRRLKFPNRLARSLRDLAHLKADFIGPHLSSPHLTPSRLYYALHRLSPLALQAASMALGPGPAQEKINFFLASLRHVKPCLDGDALVQMGVPPGPRLGRLLRGLLEARLDGQVATREEEVSLIQRWLGRET